MITDTLRTAAKESGLTQTQLAKAAGTTQRAISEFLAGKNGLQAASLDRLAESCGAKLKLPKGYKRNLQKIADRA